MGTSFIIKMYDVSKTLKFLWEIKNNSKLGIIKKKKKSKKLLCKMVWSTFGNLK